MSSIHEEATFAAKIRKNNRSKLSPSKKSQKQIFATKLLFILAGFIALLGLIIGIGFILIMETTFTELGGTSAGTLVEQVNNSDPAVAELVSSLGLSWIPTFIKIYAIRWPITLGVIAFFSAIALIVFSIALSRKKKS